jgi:large subunit ribosomal protein L5
MQAELYKEYQAKVIPALSKSQGYKNVFQVPKVDKVVLKTCISSQCSDLKKALEDAKK